MLTPILNCVKSTNSTVRSSAVQLFKELAHRSVSDDDLQYVVEAILTPASTGKSTGPEHRQALYLLLTFVPPSPRVSSLIVRIVTPLMEKETNDAALSAISEALPKHIVDLLRNSVQLETATVSVIMKEMSSAKPASRKTAIAIIGQVFWDLSLLINDGEKWPIDANLLLDKLKPALDKILKDAPTNSLAVGVGPLEAWIALSIILSSPQVSDESKFP
jgi:hypothetical protein